ncbi:hypothetical protein B0H13DRAFT_2304206 [Mycena leptocephala]|nr:hypothetical protein B0H13DRAFT_2304206 [Mycena leptocephala]
MRYLALMLHKNDMSRSGSSAVAFPPHAMTNLSAVGLSNSFFSNVPSVIRLHMLPPASYSSPHRIHLGFLPITLPLAARSPSHDPCLTTATANLSPLLNPTALPPRAPVSASDSPRPSLSSYLHHPLPPTCNASPRPFRGRSVNHYTSFSTTIIAPLHLRSYIPYLLSSVVLSSPFLLHSRPSVRVPTFFSTVLLYGSAC